LDQLNYGGVDTFKATLDCLGKIMIHDYPAKVSISLAYLIAGLKLTVLLKI
jgi:hypothetical protein